VTAIEFSSSAPVNKRTRPSCWASAMRQARRLHAQKAAAPIAMPAIDTPTHSLTVISMEPLLWAGGGGDGGGGDSGSGGGGDSGSGGGGGDGGDGGNAGVQ